MSIPKNELIQTSRFDMLTKTCIPNLLLVEKHKIKKHNSRCTIEYYIDPYSQDGCVVLKSRHLTSMKDRKIEHRKDIFTYQTWDLICTHFKNFQTTPIGKRLANLINSRAAELKEINHEYYVKTYTRHHHIVSIDSELASEILNPNRHVRQFYPKIHNGRNVIYALEFYDYDGRLAMQYLSDWMIDENDIDKLIMQNSTDDGVIPVAWLSKTNNLFPTDLPPDQWDGVILGVGTDGPRQIIMYNPSPKEKHLPSNESQEKE